MPKPGLCPDHSTYSYIIKSQELYPLSTSITCLLLSISTITPLIAIIFHLNYYKYHPKCSLHILLLNPPIHFLQSRQVTINNPNKNKMAKLSSCYFPLLPPSLASEVRQEQAHIDFPTALASFQVPSPT